MYEFYTQKFWVMMTVTPWYCKHILFNTRAVHAVVQGHRTDQFCFFLYQKRQILGQSLETREKRHASILVYIQLLEQC